MDVRKLLEEVKRGDTSIEEAENAFKNLPYEDLGYAKLDLHRKLRSGFPETVFCQGKPDAYLADIFETLYRENGEVLGTRATPEQWNLVRARIPEIEYDPVSKILQARKSSETPWKLEGLVAICTGGTADIPVAEEAAKTAEFFGCRVERYYDIGVAGIHRLLSKREAIARANCVIAVAGIPVFFRDLLLRQTLFQEVQIAVYILKQRISQLKLTVFLHRVAIIIGNHTETADYQDSDQHKWNHDLIFNL